MQRVIYELPSCFAGHVKWGKNTQAPKKTYKATAGAVLCCVGYVDRLVWSISKIFLRRENRALLSTAEEIYGRSLEKNEIAK